MEEMKTVVDEGKIGERKEADGKRIISFEFKEET